MAPAPEELDVVLLSQSDCALCDDAKRVLDRLSREYPLSVRMRDLASPEGRDLGERAGLLFPPGLLLDGRPYSYGRVSERKLRRELDKRLGR
ncbi:MAG: glutaredoxin family protein [Thermoleophilaceae bacterium]